MSGICGIVMLDGSMPGRTDLAAMTAQLARRGPDGTHHWHSGNAALGHTLLATTPEALVETLPLADPPSGCTITADCRLDNREDLIASLNLSDADRVLGDGELILRAYLQWGEECPAKLLGDFAFAIWDPRAETLFCARDHMGMKQFNYCYIPGRFFVFATEDTAMLAHRGVPGAVDVGRIADLIVDLEGFDLTSTFFESIKRLPPAHSMSINPGGLQLVRYWTLQPGPMLRLATDEAYAKAFKAIFTEAVRARMRTANGIAAMLSGGLDSTSVATIAAEISVADNKGSLTTISAVSPAGVDCAETKAIHSALTNPEFSPIFVNLADLGGMAEQLITTLDECRNPFEVNGSMVRSIYLAARQSGKNVVLDGGGGDVILTSDNRIATLLSQRRPRQALSELRDQLSFWKLDKPTRFAVAEIASAIWVAFAPPDLRRRWRRFRVSGRIPGAAVSFAKKAGLAQRRRIADEALRVVAAADPVWRAQAILHPNLVSGRERFDQLAASAGVESRDPFMDIRVIAFCLSLPPDQLQSGGWPKVILRRAMDKLLPEDIVWRRGKEHLGWSFTLAVLGRWSEWADSMCDPSSPLRNYLTPSALRRLSAARNNPTGPRLRLFALDRFLRRYDRGVQHLMTSRIGPENEIA